MLSGSHSEVPDTRFPHFTAAYEYGKHSAELSESIARTWDDVAPLLASGWAGRHRDVCGCHLDWRLSFPRVEEGWKSVRQ